MIVLEIIGQVIWRLGIFAIATFLAVSVGLMDYMLIQGVVYLVHHGHLGQFGLEFTIFQGLVLFVGGCVIAVMGCGSIGVFGWGLLGMFDFD